MLSKTYSVLPGFSVPLSWYLIQNWGATTCLALFSSIRQKESLEMGPWSFSLLLPGAASALAMLLPLPRAEQSWAELTNIWRCFSCKGESKAVSHLFPALLRVADLWFSPSSCLVPSFSWAIKSLPSMIQVGHRRPNSIHIWGTTNL